MRKLKITLAVLALAGIATALAQTFPVTETFRQTDTFADVKRKLVQSSVTISNLQAISETDATAAGLANLASTHYGTVNLSSGAATVTNSLVGSTSLIFLTRQTLGGTITNGTLAVSAKDTTNHIVTITSGTAAETNTVAYFIYNP